MLIQIYLAITGLAAIWLTQQHREEWKKYASIIGLAGQPAWIYTTWVSEQWGIFVLSIAYTWTWYMGFSNYWLRPRQSNP